MSCDQGTTHWEGCEEVHHECALVRLADARRERDEARADIARIRSEREPWIAEHNETVAALEDAMGKLQDSPVQCDCHPHVRWPVETWGERCPLTKAEAERDAARRAVVRLRRELELSALAGSIIDGRRIEVICECDNDRGVTDGHYADCPIVLRAKAVLADTDPDAPSAGDV